MSGIETVSTVFARFTSPGEEGKPLKRLSGFSLPDTGLKPGASENFRAPYEVRNAYSRKHLLRNSIIYVKDKRIKATSFARK
jgi:hypothetical protein